MRRNFKFARALLAALATAVFAAAPLHAQAPDKGKLLVATDDMLDPNYRQTVVLLLHHDGNGTIGVAINRPTWLGLEEVQPDVGPIDGFEGRVFRGGPLAPTQVIFLVRNPPAGAFDAPPILGRVYASGNLAQLEDLSALGDPAIRLYAGHSEWAAGQLDREIAAGQWTVVDGSAERVFDVDTGEMWPRLSSGGPELLVRGVE